MNRQESAANARKKQLEKYGGDEEKLKEAQRERGRKTGIANKGKMVGFAANRERASKAGKLSGYTRRMKKRNEIKSSR